MTWPPTIAVLAGGLATRMRPVTATIPKAMIPVAGEPFISHQLRKFAREGLTHAVLCVGHLSEQIESFVGDGARFGLKVDFKHDGPVLLGTGGALRSALPLLGTKFFVTWGDAYLDIPYRPVWDAWRSAAKPALMTVLHNAGQWDTSNVLYRDGSVVSYNKVAPTPAMAWIDYGLLGFDAAVFEARTTGEKFDLADVQRDLAATGCMAGFEVTQRFYEIGSPEGLAATELHLRRVQ